MLRSTFLLASLLCMKFSVAQYYEIEESVPDTNTYVTEGKIYSRSGVSHNFAVGYTNYIENGGSRSFNNATTTSTAVCTNLSTAGVAFRNRYYMSAGGNPDYSNKTYSTCDIDNSTYAITGIVAPTAGSTTGNEGTIFYARVNKTTGIPAVMRSIVLTSLNNTSYSVGRKIIFSGGFCYITGTVYNTAAAGPNEQLVVIKLDLTGTVIWSRIFDMYNVAPNERNTVGNDILVSGPNIYVAGKTKGITLGSLNSGHDHAFIAKLDLAGNLINFQSYNYGGENSVFNSFVMSPSGNLVAVGHYEYLIGTLIPLIMEITPALTVNWMTSYELNPPTVGGMKHTLSDIYYGAATNSYFMTGTFNKTPAMPSSNDIFVMNLNTTGALLSCRSIPSFLEEDEGVSIDALPAYTGSNGFSIFATTKSFSTLPTKEMFVIKTANTLSQSCNLVTLSASDVFNTIVTNSYSYSVSPNHGWSSLVAVTLSIDVKVPCKVLPFKEDEDTGGKTGMDASPLTFYMSAGNGEHELTTIPVGNRTNEVGAVYDIDVYDYSGKRVIGFKAQEGESLTFTGLATGMYIMKVFNSGNLVGYKKFLVN
ncbi:MAG: T9SS type A sorting domain-containing protein [Bacteroidota bacterium]